MAMAGDAAAKKLAEAMRKTLNLPSTGFPMRANAVRREPELHARCVTHVYAAQRNDRADRDVFVLHDGPPFANGQLHMGHFLNKVLKDVMNRYKLLRGFRIDYVPGWDCHGLPIEVKALGRLQQSQDLDKLSPSEVRRLSRELAQAAVVDQKNDYLRWGVLADWDDVYLTMAPEYEAKQYDVLKRMVHDGLIFRGFKPVYWSPSSRTALAESELEYQDDHASHAAYVKFPLRALADNAELQQSLGHVANLSAVIWTTTPWTIPSNQALCVNARLEYVAVQPPGSSESLLVARELLPKFAAAIGVEESELKVVASVEGKWLEGSRFAHPLDASRDSVLLLGDHVTVDAGTGVVHTAPGHGQDDYFVWMARHHALKLDGPPEILCPVDDAGRFTADAGDALVGREVLSDGNAAVLDLLSTSGALLARHVQKHRYPYDWRSKQPVILRATAQWFAKLDGLHAAGERVLAEEVELVPKAARRRLEATLASRSEWCISRQRAWGLPIPVFYHKATGEPLMTEETIAHLQSVVSEYKTGDGREGADCWWDLPVVDLLPPSLKSEADQYKKGMDTLDVWFDSGSSWYTVLKDRGEPTKRADVYFEGSDQHRGWFQSSLLTSLAMQQTAPYKHVVTHGFTLDERGLKMSKSLGNTIAPREFIDGATLSIPNANPKKKPKQLKVPPYGADVLRYWAASVDYTGDMSVGPSVVGKVSDSLRKVRNTARFLLANLNDFDPAKHAVPRSKMSQSVDRYMLHELVQLEASVTGAYETFAFSRVEHAVAHFISTDLSAFYMEAAKDRLYCDGKDSASRRAAQTVLWLALQSLSRAIAPIVPHAAEDMRLHLLSQIQGVEVDAVEGSIFLEEGWMPRADEWVDPRLAQQWKAVRQLRLEVNRLVEKLRSSGEVGSQLECNVVVATADPKVRVLLAPESLGDGHALENVLLCSGVEVVETLDASLEGVKCRLPSFGDSTGDEVEVEVAVTRAKGHKCPRCWKYAAEVDEAETLLCRRCAEATGLDGVAELAAKLVQDEA